ncbi:MAG TPA: rRNA maturation RNase YbeY [Candidatus Binatia bacterium]|nr:rRNA maturation RNase YbeY [Candidatus Binatia bacterium]
MPIAVHLSRRCDGVSAAAVHVWARQILSSFDEDAAELTVSLVDDEEIHRFNRDYRGKDRPTDVLAFAMREGPRVAGDEAQLGDVVISLDTAARQAAQRGTTLADEVATLLIHGVLHLLGYDHERSAAEARRMRRKERELRALISSRPASRGTKIRRGSAAAR